MRQTKRGYLLRSYVHCGLCDHRMFGKTRLGHAYYCCYPAGNNADRLDRDPADHPKAIYVREDALTEALDHVIATRVFGPDRHALLRRELADRPDKQRHADAAHANGLRERIADLPARRDRLIVELEPTDPTDRAFRDRLRGRFDALKADRTAKVTELDEQKKLPLREDSVAERLVPDVSIRNGKQPRPEPPEERKRLGLGPVEWCRS